MFGGELSPAFAELSWLLAESWIVWPTPSRSSVGISNGFNVQRTLTKLRYVPVEQLTHGTFWKQ